MKDITIEIVQGYNENNPLLQQAGRIRAAVHVYKDSRYIRVKDGIESDQFDHEQAVYIIALIGKYQVVGVVRLLPYQSGLLYHKVQEFPLLVQQKYRALVSAALDMSRFTVAEGSPFGVGVKVLLLKAALDYALANRYERLVAYGTLTQANLPCFMRLGEAHGYPSPEGDGSIWHSAGFALEPTRINNQLLILSECILSLVRCIL